MIKNQLYPFIEKYINEYLYGFTKEQLNVGVMNGIIALEGLNIRVDKVNEKLDNLEIPIWLKAGSIKKIRISCSLMNFIGEKPLDVNVEEIECLICPSFKWILKNLSTYIEENEYYIKEAYDPTDNNSHDIFSRKINIYDSSIIKKEKLFEIFSDPSKLSQILNKLFTKCLKFYYHKAYLINLKIKNIHLRFEDDELMNYFSDIGLGLKISNLEINLSAEGTKKKNNFKCENLNFYWEPKPNILIPTKKFRESFKENIIDEKYYEYLKTLDYKNQNFANKCFIIENFNFMGNLGIHFIESGNIDFFSKREKNYKFSIQVATSELNLNIYPEIIKIAQRIVDFMKSFYVIDPVQDFKPMRKPYNKLSELVKKFKNDPTFEFKRKRVVRDWIFYLIWFQRFKNAIYGNAFTNPLFSEFSKYFNICVVPNSNSNDLQNGFPHINDSFYMKKNELSAIEPNLEKNGGNNSLLMPNSSAKAVVQKEENLNPENINLCISTEILIKSVNLHIHSNYLNNKNHDYLFFRLSGLDIKSLLLKEKFEASFEIKNIVVNNKIQYEINKNLDNQINDEILSSNTNNNHNFDKLSVYNGNLTNYTESEKTLVKEKTFITRTATLGGNANTLHNNINDSFTSDVVFSSPNRKNNEDNFFYGHQHSENATFNAEVKVENPKLNKRLYMIHNTLDKLKQKQHSKNVQNKNENTFITFFLNEENQGTIKDNSSVNSGLHSIKSNMPKMPFIQNDVEYTLSQNQNVNLSKMINEYNKNKIKQKNNTSAVKIVPRPSNLRNIPIMIKNESNNANVVSNLVTTNSNAKNIANYSNISNNLEKKYVDSTRNLNENANVKIPVNLVEISSLTSNTNQTSDLSKSNFSAISPSLSLRISKNFQNKKSNFNLAFNLGTCRVNLVEKNLESTLNISLDYILPNVLGKKSDENANSFLFKNKLFGVMDMNYTRQIYDMKHFILNKLLSKIQSKEKETLNGDNLEYYNYVKKDMDQFDHNFLLNGNFELNYLFSTLQFGNIEINLNFNEFHIVNLSYEDDTQKNIIKSGKIKIPRNYFKFLYHPQKTLLFKFFDFEIEFNETQRLRKILTEVGKIFEEKLQGQLSGVDVIFRPVIKKILDARTLSEKQIEKEIKHDNKKQKILTSGINEDNSVKQMNKKSSIKQIQTEFQKILNNNNMNTNNNPISNVEKVKNPFEDNSENTFNQSHISFDDDVDVKIVKSKKSNQNLIKEKTEEEKNNKNDLIKKKNSGTVTKIKPALGINNNNFRYEESIANPLKFSDDSEFFYNVAGNDKFNESSPVKIFTDDQQDSSRTLPKGITSAKDVVKNKPSENSKNVYIGKYNK